MTDPPATLENLKSRDAISLTWYHEGKTTPMVYKTVRALLPPVLERRHRAGNISGRNAVQHR
jgi:hypothetical protein